MSATVDADKIASYMGPGTPVITVPGRTFPVSTLWLEDVVELTRYKLDATTDSPYISRGMRSECLSGPVFALLPTNRRNLHRQ